MKMHYVKVLRIHPAAAPGEADRPRFETVEMENTLESFQEAVGGLIEVVAPLGDGTDWICNEEGKLLSLPPCVAWLGENGRVLDLIVGEIVVVRHDSEGNFTSIRREDVVEIVRQFCLRQVVALV